MGKWTGTGNRIGHDPKHLRPFRRDPQSKDPPAIIHKVKARIEELARRPRACPQIFFHHPDKADERRQERSEGRERDSAYLCSMVDHMDLVSLRIGVPRKDGGFYRYSVEDLAMGTGMEFDPVNLVEELKAGGMPEAEANAKAQEEKEKKKGKEGRFHRAAMRMNEKGFVCTARRSGKKGRGPDNLYSSRVVSMSLARAIGMEAEVATERTLEAERRRNGGLTAEEASAARPTKTKAQQLVEARAKRLERPAPVEELVAGVLNRIPSKPPKPP